MSEKQLEISVHDNNSLLVKDYTIKKRYEQKSNEKLLSDDIYLPGYEKKPIRIGVYGDVSRNRAYVFIENSDFGPDDVNIYIYHAFHGVHNKYSKYSCLFLTFIRVYS